MSVTSGGFEVPEDSPIATVTTPPQYCGQLDEPSSTRIGCPLMLTDLQLLSKEAPKKKFHVFINYRVATDAALAEKYVVLMRALVSKP